MEAREGDILNTVFGSYVRERPSIKRWAVLNYIEAFVLQPGSLLDVGCGNGFWGDIFHEEGWSVTGFDVNEAYIADGRERYPALNLFVADATKPFDVGAFDLVFCRGISQLYAPDPDEAMPVITEMLKHITADGHMLLAAYTDGSGKPRPGVNGGMLWHHPVRSFPDMVQRAGGEVLAFKRDGKTVQVLAR